MLRKAAMGREGVFILLVRLLMGIFFYITCLSLPFPPHATPHVGTYASKREVDRIVWVVVCSFVARCGRIWWFVRLRAMYYHVY